MSEEFKACPFCGGKVDFLDMGDNRISVYCKKCEVTLGQVWGINGSKDELAIRFNARPIEDALQSEITCLTQRVRELEDANRWIPVSERLPEKSDAYQTIQYHVRSGKKRQGKYLNFFDIDEKDWGIFGSCVKFWRENLPLPPMPEKKK